MFILIILILESSSLKVDICTVISMINVPCDQECLKFHSPDRKAVILKNSCMNDYTDLVDCLISTKSKIELLLPLFSTCFSDDDYGKILQNLSFLESQFECISYFTTFALNDLLQTDDSLLKSKKYELKDFDAKNCKTKAHGFGKSLAEHAFENKENKNVEDIIMLLLENHGELTKAEKNSLEINQKKKNDKFDEDYWEKKFQEELKKYKKETEEAYAKYKKEQEEKFEKEHERIRKENEDLKKSQSAITIYNENSSLYNRFVSALIYILDVGGMSVYCAVNRLDEKMPISKLKNLIPEVVLKNLEKYLDEAKIYIGTDKYVCSQNLNMLVDGAVSLLLYKENLIYSAAAHSLISIIDYITNKEN